MRLLPTGGASGQRRGAGDVRRGAASGPVRMAAGQRPAAAQRHHLGEGGRGPPEDDPPPPAHRRGRHLLVGDGQAEVHLPLGPLLS